jgi:hypothetical protein
VCDWGPIHERNPTWFDSELCCQGEYSGFQEAITMAKKGAGSRSRKGYVANTKAPKGSYAIPARSPVGGRGRAKYPINTIGRARNALARVSAHGSAKEKSMVHSAVRRKYPGLAKRSSVIRTRSGKRK